MAVMVLKDKKIHNDQLNLNNDETCAFKNVSVN